MHNVLFYLGSQNLSALSRVEYISLESGARSFAQKNNTLLDLLDGWLQPQSALDPHKVIETFGLERYADVPVSSLGASVKFGLRALQAVLLQRPDAIVFVNSHKVKYFDRFLGVLKGFVGEHQRELGGMPVLAQGERALSQRNWN